MHFACLLPAVAVVLGTYRLARNFCRHPQFAALTVLCSPGFLVSSTTVMCDVAMLAPFLAKPFNIDDPLYIWAAQQIQVHPGNPYGFEVNWFGIAEPMWSATQKPSPATWAHSTAPSGHTDRCAPRWFKPASQPK